MPLMRKLATLAAAAEAGRRYARKNPDKAGKYLDQAAAFVDKQTKGKYTAQISGAAQKVKSVAGVPGSGGGHSAANGYPQGAAGYSAPQPSSATVPSPDAPTTRTSASAPNPGPTSAPKPGPGPSH
ncbi:antitoxin [Pseudonocardia humida]|uniref:Antitoxin n=1 Tax=Pseudonocardia humida TaxID=2800819 RepID=A0ABT1A1Z1_9PSEU|nr:Rv0909 family putative TA system antitoxin [Pseudonocardia humida]MCO1656909.1 antitoxin [Pseudonocardia humida]